MVWLPLAGKVLVLRHGRPVHASGGKVCRAESGTRPARLPCRRLPLEQRACTFARSRRRPRDGFTLAVSKSELVPLPQRERGSRLFARAPSTREDGPALGKRSIRGPSGRIARPHPETAPAGTSPTGRRSHPVAVTPFIAGRHTQLRASGCALARRVAYCVPKLRREGSSSSRAGCSESKSADAVASCGGELQR